MTQLTTAKRAQILSLLCEGGNLTMRMHMRRFKRPTNTFSKRLENHTHMVAIYAVWYNWVRIHKTLRVTPAMAAGLTDRVWDMPEVVKLIEANEMRGRSN